MNLVFYNLSLIISMQVFTHIYACSTRPGLSDHHHILSAPGCYKTEGSEKREVVSSCPWIGLPYGQMQQLGERNQNICGENYYRLNNFSFVDLKILESHMELSQNVDWVFCPYLIIF